MSHAHNLQDSGFSLYIFSHKQKQRWQCVTHLWPLVGKSFHYLRGGVERTPTVRLQQSAPLEVIGEAEVSQLQNKEKESKRWMNSHIVNVFILCPLLFLVLAFIICYY